MTENNTIENNHTDSEANILMMKKIVKKDYTLLRNFLCCQIQLINY